MDFGTEAKSLTLALRHLNSDEFDGVVNIYSFSPLTDAMAQDLGLAMLRKKDKIQHLSIPIGNMMPQTAAIAYPALLEYFETAMPSSQVEFCGDPMTLQRTGTQRTTHEVLDMFLKSMVKQNRFMPSISIRFICLSKTSMVCLEAFSKILFMNCDMINDHNEDRSNLTPAPKKTIAQQREMHECCLFFSSCSSTSLMRAARGLILNTRGVVGVHFDPSLPNHEELLNSAIELVKSKKQRTENDSIEQFVHFSNLDTDGSRVVQTMLDLSPHAAFMPMGIHFQWQRESDKVAVQRRAESIAEAMSHCRFWLHDVEVKNAGSIFNAQQLEATKKVSNLNICIPRLIDDKPEEFWMENLWLMKQLFHPERLMHPRFRDVYFRFLRNNFNVCRLILSWYRETPVVLSGPASRTRLRRAAALSAESSRDSTPRHVYDGPACRTRRRARSDTVSSRTAKAAKRRRM